MTGSADMSSEDDLLVAEYVLGVLPHAERVTLAARLAAEPALQNRVLFWEDQLAPLGAALEPVEPPASVLAAVEQRLFPAEAEGQGMWRSLPFWRGLSAALFCALLAGLALFIVQPWRAGVPVAPSYVASLSGPSGTVDLMALYDRATGTLKINRVSGAPAAGRDFQLWIIVGKEPPVSLGVLPGDASATLSLAPDVGSRLAPSAVLAISDEPKGGSPTGQPTGAVLATGVLTAI